MKKTVKKIITGILITAITLAAGFGITILSFNLFDNLTDNQMKILFAIDVFSLSVSALGVMYFFESKKYKEQKRKAFEKRKLERIEEKDAQLRELNEIINCSNFAA